VDDQERKENIAMKKKICIKKQTLSKQILLRNKASFNVLSTCPKSFFCVDSVLAKRDKKRSVFAAAAEFNVARKPCVQSRMMPPLGWLTASPLKLEMAS
jgi:hypothetical protein